MGINLTVRKNLNRDVDDCFVGTVISSYSTNGKSQLGYWHFRNMKDQLWWALGLMKHSEHLIDLDENGKHPIFEKLDKEQHYHWAWVFAEAYDTEWIFTNDNLQRFVPRVKKLISDGKMEKTPEWKEFIRLGEVALKYGKPIILT